MMNFLKNKRKVIIMLTLTLTFSGSFFALAADPGSEKDPLISLSYFDNKIKELKEEILDALSKDLNEKFDKTEKEIESSLDEIKEKGVSSPSTFEVVNLTENETLICDAGTEIIVRSGKFTAVGGATGGVSDVTAGKDLITDEVIINNHLLIIPKSDGRGITAKIAGAVMIKGNYEKQSDNKENGTI